MQMFEFNQLQAETRCDRLHELLEKDLLFSIRSSQMALFYQTKQEVVNLTAFTQQFTSKFLQDC